MNIIKLIYLCNKAHLRQQSANFAMLSLQM